MGGGGFYEGLPHPHPTQSYWQTPPHTIANHRTTAQLPESADYVVVGSGITGASVVTQLLEQKPKAKILILEARTACSGATGRNGGHCRAGFWTRFKKHVDLYGASEALKLEQLEADNVRLLTSYAREHDIACDLHALEAADIWHSADEFAEALENLSARDKLRASSPSLSSIPSAIAGHRVYRGDEARAYFQMPDIAGGVAFDGYTLWPYKFVCALLERAISAGANLQTTTPVLSVAKDGDAWTVRTERGAVRTAHVVLATNAYTGALWPALSHAVIPTRGQVVAVRPGTGVAGSAALDRSLGLASGGLEDYMQQRPAGMQGAGDIIYGGGRMLSRTGEQGTVDDSVVNPDISAHLQNAAPAWFGRQRWGPNGATLMEWSGIMGYTMDSEPLVGQVPGSKGLWVCAGFNGHGMGLAFRSAQALVEMLVAGKPPHWFPTSLLVDRVCGDDAGKA